VLRVGVLQRLFERVSSGFGNTVGFAIRLAVLRYFTAAYQALFSQIAE
jgi:hypothetical protein